MPRKLENAASQVEAAMPLGSLRMSAGLTVESRLEFVKLIPSFSKFRLLIRTLRVLMGFQRPPNWKECLPLCSEKSSRKVGTGLTADEPPCRAYGLVIPVGNKKFN